MDCIMKENEEDGTVVKKEDSVLDTSKSKAETSVSKLSLGKRTKTLTYGEMLFPSTPLPQEFLNYSGEMPEFIINITQAILGEKKWELALDFLSMIGYYVPPQRIFHSVITKALMENKSTFSAASIYAKDLLKLFSPCVDGNFYFNALFPSKIQLNIYDHIHKLLICCLNGSCSNSTVKDPEESCNKNCFSLLKFIIYVLTVEHKEQKAISVTSKPEASFICRIFWPTSKPNTINEDCKRLIRLMNSLFEKKNIEGDNITFEVWRILQNILSMLLESLLYSSSFTEVEAVYYSSVKIIAEMSQAICSGCPNVFSDPLKMNLFLHTQCSRWFKIILCNTILNYLIKGQWTLPQNISLRNIVFNYMFTKLELQDGDKCIIKCEKPEQRIPVKRRRPFHMHSSSNNKKIESTRIPVHKACMNDYVDTLDALLNESDESVNVKDYYGRTPLHYACARNNYLCAKIYLEHMKDHCTEGRSFEETVFIPDCHGQTPLHICVDNDSVDVVWTLLKFGAAASLSAVDIRGCVPADLVRSSQMKAYLNDHINHFKKPELFLQSGDFMCYQGATPVICGTSKKCAMQISCLYVILTEYVNFFQLNDLNSKKRVFRTSLKDTVRNHFIEECKHEPNNNEVIQLCDDLYILKNFQLLFKEFKGALSQHVVYDHVSNSLRCLELFADCL